MNWWRTKGWIVPAAALVLIVLVQGLIHLLDPTPPCVTDEQCADLRDTERGGD
jgi:hypothetical protein